MTEQELRVLVRQAIARAQRGTATTPPGGSSRFGDRISLDPAHAMFVIADGSDAGGPCIIEPAVPCNHCGYCKSMGH